MISSEEFISRLSLVESLLADAASELDGMESRCKQEKNYQKARMCLTHQEKLATLTTQFVTLRTELERDLMPEPKADVPKAEKPKDDVRIKNSGREKARDLTKNSDPAYYLPILQALVERNGRAAMTDVLKRVEAIMKPRLTKHDYEPMNKSPELRWRNTARWARSAMVNKLGYMKKGSPTGIWEISDRGREYLRQNS